MRTEISNRKGITTSSLVAVIGMVVIVAATGYYLLGYMSLVNNATFNVVVTTTFYDIPQTNTVPTTVVTTVYQTTTVTGQSPLVFVSIINGTAYQKLPFEPSKLLLVIGVNNTVKWTNNDTALHTVSSRTVPASASSFDSGNMVEGAVFTYTFTVPGNYTYFSKYDPSMVGTVSVLP